MEVEKDLIIETPLPNLKQSEVFPEGHIQLDIIEIVVPPTNNNSEFDNLHNIIQFDIPCTKNGLDPKHLFFEGDLFNPDPFNKEVDNSFHSLIKKIIVYDGVGTEIELIDDYDSLMAIYFDMTLSRSERLKRQKNEGFGVNKYVK